MNSARRLAVIPARGGSKRIPKKNVRDFFGQPLMAYTIKAALESDLFADVVVSTDDEEIAFAARRCGAEVPFMREPGLADDHTPVSLVTVNTVEKLAGQGRHYDHIAQLMPNCPLRTTGDVKSSYAQFVANGGRAPQLSVIRYGWQNPWWAMRRADATFVLQPLFAEAAVQRSQDLPELFCPTGAIWWAPVDVLCREKTFHVAGRTGWEISWQQGIDIDTEDDWQCAELLMKLFKQQSAQNGSK